MLRRRRRTRWRRRKVMIYRREWRLKNRSDGQDTWDRMMYNLVSW
jgi:hypothetical protein